jgi:hypothetical protein
MIFNGISYVTVNISTGRFDPNYERPLKFLRRRLQVPHFTLACLEDRAARRESIQE